MAPIDRRAALLLIDPKFPHNVGGALRAASCFGAANLTWTGRRVPPPSRWPEGARLPREERMKLYRTVSLDHSTPAEAMELATRRGYTPVCVEVLDSSESLPEFVHPDKALYVFGPEDGNVPKGVRHACHRFVTIPTVGPLNLAAAANVILYDRLVKGDQDASER